MNCFSNKRNMFTTNEFCEMVLLYGKCNRNKREAARQYAIKFPGARHPSENTIVRAVKRLRKTGSIKNYYPSDRVAASSLHIHDDEVLGYAFAQPESSVRDISKACSYSKSQVWRILNRHGAYPYRPTLGQSFLPGDEERRFDFCNSILNNLENNPSFVNDILWSDECQFTRQGVVNTHNAHYWSLENPHIIRPNRHQVRWSVNVWCGMWKNTIIGPFFFDGPLTSATYANILSGPLSDYLEEYVSLWDFARMWFQHDGAPAHKSLQPRTFLSNTFGNNIIGYGGACEWPPRSPDLTPLDFFLWGYLKNKVYERESTSKADLINRISMACKSITPTMLHKVPEEFLSRVRFCISAEGSHFEQILR